MTRPYYHAIAFDFDGTLVRKARRYGTGDSNAPARTATGKVPKTRVKTDSMTTPRDAVILAAGLGSRFGDEDQIKQLARLTVFGLVERNARIMARAGLERLILVVGYRGERVKEVLEGQLSGLELTIEFVHNAEYKKANGISAMAGGEAASGTFVLLMADHVFDPAILEHAVTHDAPESGGTLYVDRKIDEVYDIEDATLVNTDTEGRIIDIGKTIEVYNAVDTGIFVMTQDLTRALRGVYNRRGDASLSDGVQVLADSGMMSTRDVGGSRWQDVDTLDALHHARELFEDGKE